MTLAVNQWYRVADTGQFAQVQRIPSTTDPRISVPRADQNTRGFEVALVWYTPVAASSTGWTKRVLIMETRKALALLREPGDADRTVLVRLKAVAATIPVSSASRDGEFTLDRP